MQRLYMPVRAGLNYEVFCNSLSRANISLLWMDGLTLTKVSRRMLSGYYKPINCEYWPFFRRNHRLGHQSARDLGPRLVHFLLPISGKGNSDWSYAWIPVVAPIAGAIAGALVHVMVFQ